jgi:hypothetical protein
MRKLLFVGIPLLMLGSAAMAQGKIDTKWHCDKPTTDNKVDVGDMAGHTYGIAQGTCTATSSSKGFAEKSGSYTEFQDSGKMSMSSHGHFMVTMDNSDMLHYSYVGKGSSDMKKPMSNTWTIVGGTGKHKGIKGSGSCTGMGNADGSSDWTCSGTYSMGPMKSKAIDKSM